MTLPHQTPFAVLSAANGSKLHDIGRGLLTINDVTVAAFIFDDNDLVHNLLLRPTSRKPLVSFSFFLESLENK
jgi:hypothetical protein